MADAHVPRLFRKREQGRLLVKHLRRDGVARDLPELVRVGDRRNLAASDPRTITRSLLPCVFRSDYTPPLPAPDTGDIGLDSGRSSGSTVLI